MRRLESRLASTSRIIAS